MDANQESVERTEHEIIVTRLIDAPRDLVYRVWTSPDHVVRWWGPDGFTNTNLEMDVRAGGKWRYVMHGPDGRDYPNQIVYREVVPGEKLVYDHDDDGAGAIAFFVTVTFEDRAGKTLLTMRSEFPSAAVLRKVVEEYGALDGARQHVAKLAAYVATL